MLPIKGLIRIIQEYIWLVVSTHLKNISQIGSFPQVGMKIKIFETTTQIITVHACTQKLSPIPYYPLSGPDSWMIYHLSTTNDSTTELRSQLPNSSTHGVLSHLPSFQHFGPQPRHQGFAFHGGSQEFRVVLKFWSSTTSNERNFEKRAVALRLLLVTKSTTNQFFNHNNSSGQDILLHGSVVFFKFSFSFFRCTLPKTHMDPENHLFEKENHLNHTSIFVGFHISFRGSNGISPNWTAAGSLPSHMVFERCPTLSCCGTILGAFPNFPPYFGDHSNGHSNNQPGWTDHYLNINSWWVT